MCRYPSISNGLLLTIHVVTFGYNKKIMVNRRNGAFHGEGVGKLQPNAKSSPISVFINHICCNSTTPVHFRTVSGCFGITMAELSGFNRHYSLHGLHIFANPCYRGCSVISEMKGCYYHLEFMLVIKSDDQEHLLIILIIKHYIRCLVLYIFNVLLYILYL